MRSVCCAAGDEYNLGWTYDDDEDDDRGTMMRECMKEGMSGQLKGLVSTDRQHSADGREENVGKYEKIVYK